MTHLSGWILGEVCLASGLRLQVLAGLGRSGADRGLASCWITGRRWSSTKKHLLAVMRHLQIPTSKCARWASPAGSARATHPDPLTGPVKVRRLGQNFCLRSAVDAEVLPSEWGQSMGGTGPGGLVPRKLVVCERGQVAASQGENP